MKKYILQAVAAASNPATGSATATANNLLRLYPIQEWQDLGPANADSVDYPDYADLVAKKLFGAPPPTSSDLAAQHFGVLICGSGQGVAIRANRYSHVRAALCFSEETAEMARAHNNANVLCLGSRLTPPDQALKILIRFLNTPFEGGRHERRVTKLSQKV